MTLTRLIPLVAVSGLLLAATAGAESAPLQGSVGPGFTISLSANGAKVTHLEAGSYPLSVDDKSDEHNFHIFGPGGVDAKTDIAGTGPSTFNLTLVDGKYSFVCDAHVSMNGSFTVGAVQSTPPPKPAAPQKLVLTLTAKAVTLTKAGAPVTSLTPGPAVITVRDRSATRGVKLRGAGVNKTTGIGFIGTRSWSVKLGAGTLAVTTQGKTPALTGSRVKVSASS